jgi:hypothetical protein
MVPMALRAMSYKRSALRCWIAIGPVLMSASIVHGQTVNQSLTGGADAPVGTALAPGTRGESFFYGVDAGIGESDNVTLVPTDKVSQTIAVTDIDFDLKQSSRRFDVDAKGNFSYLDFLQNAFRMTLGRRKSILFWRQFPRIGRTSTM